MRQQRNILVPRPQVASPTLPPNSEGQVWGTFVVYQALQRIDFLIRAVGPLKGSITGIYLNQAASNGIGPLQANLLPTGSTTGPSGSSPVVIASGSLTTFASGVTWKHPRLGAVAERELASLLTCMRHARGTH